MTVPEAVRSHAEVRETWQRITESRSDSDFSIVLLASYTIDPLLPYLGFGLHERGVEAGLTVGPFHQIVQQCLDDEGVLARTGADVLVVAPRFEDYAASPSDLLTVADAMAAAVRNHGCFGVLVLPPTPAGRPYGIGDPMNPQGRFATASRLRAAVLARVAASGQIAVVDAEDAIRAVGERQAYRPGLFRFARIPYAEDVFAELGGMLIRLLVPRYRGGHRAVVFAGERLVGQDGDQVLEPMLGPLRDSGVRVVRRRSCPVTDADWHEITAATGVPIRDTLVVSEDVPVEDVAVERLAVPRLVRLEGPSETWCETLERAGVFDVPSRVAGGATADADPVEAAREPEHGSGASDRTASPTSSMTLEDFTASLAVEIDVDRAKSGELDRIAEVVERAKDFTLGQDLGRERLADLVPNLITARVRDRLGDYGVGAVASVRPQGTEAVVELFSVSCPVLGRGVQEAVLGRLALVAAESGCGVLRIPCRDTGRNGITQEFLATVAGQEREVDGRQLRIVVEIAGADRELAT